MEATSEYGIKYYQVGIKIRVKIPRKKKKKLFGTRKRRTKLYEYYFRDPFVTPYEYFSTVMNSKP